MLVLTRRVGEKIMIGDDIEIEVLGHRGTQIKLGIDAPEDIAVHRLEVWRRVRADRDRARTDRSA